MKKEKINTINKIIIPKKGNTSLSDETRKKLIQDLQNISSEDLEAMGKKLEENKNKILIEEADLDYVGTSVEIGRKPAFKAKKDGKWFIMRGKEKYSDDFDDVGGLVEIGGKPAFSALKYGKWFLMRGKEKYSDDFDGVRSLVNIGGKPAFWAEKDGKQYKIGF